MANRERFEQGMCRIEKIIYLAGAVSDSGISVEDESFEDFFYSMCDDIKSRERIFGKDDELLSSVIGDNDSQEFLELLFERGKLGFIVQFATPVTQNGQSYSWGCYTTTWIYGETMEEAIEAGFKWVEDQRQSEAKKFQSKKKSKIKSLA
jgi:hypothetical protein